MKKIVSVIIPFLNESANINELVELLNNYGKTSTTFDLEVIFVDDGSRDNSVALLLLAKHVYYKGKIISLSKNFGSHAALRAGIMNSTGDYITFMYADLQDPIHLVGELYEKCLEGNEMVWAIRNKTENSFFEQLFSRWYALLMQKYAVDTYPTQGFDIVMFSGKIKKILNSSIEKNSSIFLQILSLGYKQDSIKYEKKARKNGKSKWTWGKKIKLLIDSFVSFSFAPIRLVSIIGLLIFLVGITWSVYIIARKLLLNDLESGWPTIISILLIGFGITNMSLGIIAEYLWRTLDASRNRPVFIIDEIIELNP
jgi:glycosyltransferase involved in cell wall biosynthesis